MKMQSEELAKMEEALRFVCEKMGVASERFWPAFIRKHILDAVVDFIWLGISAVVIWKFAPICFGWPPASGLDEHDIDLAKWLMRGLGFSMCVFGAGRVFDCVSQIKYLWNLEYWALKDFLSTMREVIHGEEE